MKSIKLTAYQGNMYLYYQLRTYLYYIIPVFIVLFLLMENYLVITSFLIIGGLLIIYTVLIIETQKKRNEIRLIVYTDKIIILNTKNEVVQEFKDIESMHIYFDSYFGKKSSFSLTFEMGYNRLFIIDSKQMKYRFLFIAKDRPNFVLLKEAFTVLKDKSAYRIKIFNREFW